MNKENKYKSGMIVKTLGSPYRIYMILKCREKWCEDGSDAYTLQGIAREEKNKNMFYWQITTENSLDNYFEILRGKR